MKNSIMLPVILLCATSLSLLWPVDAISFEPCQPGATVRYVNGVAAPNEQAVAAAAELLAERINEYSVTCVARVSYLYNPSAGVFVDFIAEFALQKANEIGISLAEAIWDTGRVAFGITPEFFSEADTAELLDRIVSTMLAVSQPGFSFVIDNRVYEVEALINEFRDRVITDLNRGTRVVLVGHSQGNLFANSTKVAVEGLAEPEIYRGLAVVNIANASLSAPDNLYITSRQDVVIGRLIDLNLALPANTDAGFTFQDILGHGFVKVYLRSDLPEGVSPFESMAGRLTRLIQTALQDTPDPGGSILASTSGSLFLISLMTNAAQPVGNFSSTSFGLTPVFDIAINPRGGSSVAISPSALSTFDPALRRLTRMPESNLGGNALTFDADGRLYAMSGNGLYRVDPDTGLATLLMSLGEYQSSGDLTFDSDGVMFGTARGPNGNDYLLRIDPLRFEITIVGDTGVSEIWGLYFSGGLLYGVTSNGTLLSINRVTGTADQLASLGIGDVTGLQ